MLCTYIVANPLKNKHFTREVVMRHKTTLVFTTQNILDRRVSYCCISCVNSSATGWNSINTVELHPSNDMRPVFPCAQTANPMISLKTTRAHNISTHIFLPLNMPYQCLPQRFLRVSCTHQEIPGALRHVTTTVAPRESARAPNAESFLELDGGPFWIVVSDECSLHKLLPDGISGEANFRGSAPGIGWPFAVGVAESVGDPTVLSAHGSSLGGPSAPCGVARADFGAVELCQDTGPVLGALRSDDRERCAADDA